MITETRALFWLCLVLLLKGFALFFFMLYGGVGLGPDEAQYWTWSQTIALGYYSKPPGIAWLIWAGTHLFGNTEWGVRSGALLVGTLLPLAVFGVAKACGLHARTALWSGIVMALTPLGIMASFLAITDGGVVLFWTLACIIFADAIKKQRPPNYVWMGIVILCGALFKWWSYYFWIVVIATIPFFPFLWNPRLILGMLISLIGLFPSLVWNSQHEWATFRHVSATIHNGGEGGRHVQSNFVAFLGEQAALLSPLFFIFLILAFVHLLRKGKTIPSPLVWCGWTSLIIIALYSVMALFKKIQGNWCAYAYPTAIVFLCWYMCEVVIWRSKFFWMRAGILLSVILCACMLALPTIQARGLWAAHPLPYKLNPFRHNVGWDRLHQVLEESGYDAQDHFLFGDKYQTTSILSFYGPGQKRAYFLNLHGIRKNQFSFWPSMAKEQRGKTGYFVITENAPQLDKHADQWRHENQELLKDYFDQVIFLGIHPLFYSYGHPVKGALLFKCVGYNGKVPPETGLY